MTYIHGSALDSEAGDETKQSRLRKTIREAFLMNNGTSSV